MKNVEISDKDVYERDLYEALTHIQSADEARCFMADLCTPAEVEAFRDRWRVARLLLAGKAYRAIAEETGVSVTTIGRVARFLFNGNDGYKTVLARMDIND